MIGDAKKKLQRITNLAEEMYTKVNELTQRLEETTETVDDTNARVQELEDRSTDRQDELETKLDEQRASLEAKVDEQRAVFNAELEAQRKILQAIASEHGIDVESLTEESERLDPPAGVSEGETPDDGQEAAMTGEDPSGEANEETDEERAA